MANRNNSVVRHYKDSYLNPAGWKHYQQHVHLQDPVSIIGIVHKSIRHKANVMRWKQFMAGDPSEIFTKQMQVIWGTWHAIRTSTRTRRWTEMISDFTNYVYIICTGPGRSRVITVMLNPFLQGPGSMLPPILFWRQWWNPEQVIQGKLYMLWSLLISGSIKASCLWSLLQIQRSR